MMQPFKRLLSQFSQFAGGSVAARLALLERRLAWHALRVLAPDLMYSFRLQDGSFFDYPLDSAVGHGVFVRQYEKHELDFFCSSLRPGHIVLDVGANGGLYTILASRLVGPEGHVFAFEPGSAELSILRRNISLNSLSNVTVVPRAVSDRTTSARFAISKDGALNSLQPTEHPGQNIVGWEDVPTCSLDSAAIEYGFQHIDFVKVDVEGAERLVFRGAKRLFESNPSCSVMFEAGSVNEAGFGYCATDLLAELELDHWNIRQFGPTGALTSVETGPQIGTQVVNFVASRTQAQAGSQ